MDSDKPRRPMNGFTLWLNSNRASIKAQYPHLNITEVHKKAGEIWRTVDHSVWEEKSAKANEQYRKEKKSYIAKMEKQQKENISDDDVRDSYISYNYSSGDSFNFSQISPHVVLSDATEAIKEKQVVKPKRPMFGHMMWLHSIPEFNQAQNIIEIGKKAGEMWKTVDHSIWEEKSARAFEQYKKDMKLYKKWEAKQPKRPLSAFLMWVVSSRESVKSQNPGLTASELSKKFGQIWSSIDKRVWKEKAAKAMEQYRKNLELYNATTGGTGDKRARKRPHEPAPAVQEENSSAVWEEMTFSNEETNLEPLIECPTAAAVACSHEARGSLQPRETGFVFVPQPQPSLQISYEDILNVKFTKRSPSSTQPFDLKITLKSGAGHTFCNIQMEEYHKLLDYVSSKNLLIKEDKQDDEIGAEKEEPAYLSGIKAEGEESYLDESDGSDPISSAVNFASCHEVEMKTEEVTDNLQIPECAFMLFLNSAWDSIKLEYPDLSTTAITKIGEEIWSGMSADDKTGWIEMAAQTVEQM